MNKINKGFTVNELKKMCNKMIQMGYGERHIQISQDDEGNGFHSLFYGFTYQNEDLDMFLEDGLLPREIKSTNDIIILG